MTEKRSREIVEQDLAARARSTSSAYPNEYENKKKPRRTAENDRTRSTPGIHIQRPETNSDIDSKISTPTDDVVDALLSLFRTTPTSSPRKKRVRKNKGGRRPKYVQVAQDGTITFLGPAENAMRLYMFNHTTTKADIRRRYGIPERTFVRMLKTVYSEKDLMERKRCQIRKQKRKSVRWACDPELKSIIVNAAQRAEGTPDAPNRIERECRIVNDLPCIKRRGLHLSERTLWNYIYKMRKSEPVF